MVFRQDHQKSIKRGSRGVIVPRGVFGIAPEQKDRMIIRTEKVGPRESCLCAFEISGVSQPDSQPGTALCIVRIECDGPPQATRPVCKFPR